MEVQELIYPWEEPDASEHIKNRQPVMEIPAPSGPRLDLPVRRPAQEWSPVLQRADFGAVIMCHRGYSNGRLSVLLSSIPENVPVTVCSDSIAEKDVLGDREVAEYHGASFHHATPWGGRAGNALECMKCTSWEWTLFLCDDVWLFPETCSEGLKWSLVLKEHGIPLASLAYPQHETYHQHKEYGFESWDQCLSEPWRFESLPPVPKFYRAPFLHLNPFGACMMMYRPAYEDLGGFAKEYWAHDDVYNHKIWTSGRWVNACYPGRGFVHLGAQSWHHGESVKFVGEFRDATGLDAAESGNQQRAMSNMWEPKLASIFESLGGSPHS